MFLERYTGLPLDIQWDCGMCILQDFSFLVKLCKSILHKTVSSHPFLLISESVALKVVVVSRVFDNGSLGYQIDFVDPFHREF